MLKQDIRLAIYQPDIPQNLGAMIRLCACFGVDIDLIEPCGFPFSLKALKRTAMDYIDLAKIDCHDDFDSFIDGLKQVLSKHLTKVKKDSNVKKAATRINTKKNRISQYKGYIQQLKMEIESDTAVVDKNKSLCSSLTVAVKKKK